MSQTSSAGGWLRKEVRMALQAEILMQPWNRTSAHENQRNASSRMFPVRDQCFMFNSHSKRRRQKLKGKLSDSGRMSSGAKQPEVSGASGAAPGYAKVPKPTHTYAKKSESILLCQDKKKSQLPWDQSVLHSCNFRLHMCEKHTTLTNQRKQKKYCLWFLITILYQS